MPTLSRRFSTTVSNPELFLQWQPQRAAQVLSPLSPTQIQKQRKVLESKLISALDCCTSVRQIKQVHAHLLLQGLDQCCLVLAKLIRTLTKVNAPMETYTRLIFEQVRNPNPFLWTAMIRGYILQGSISESVNLYSCMRSVGTRPLSFTFSVFFKACGAAKDVSLGRQIHAQAILVGGFASDLYVGNTMIDMYVKCGYLECGRKVFDEMPDRDVISWTELIVAYAKNGDMESAWDLFVELPVKDKVAWTAIVTGYAQNARPREALEVFERMQNEQVETDVVTLVGVISACAQLGASKYANWVRDVAESSGFGPCDDVVVGSALVDMYSKCGSVDEAFKVFEGIKEKNVFSYSSMIFGFAMHGRGHAAIQLFHDMLKSEMRPNHVTFIGVLTACSHVGLVEQGRQLFAAMGNHYGVAPSVEHYTCMVDLLGRAGHLEEALELIETMSAEPNACVWGALLGACRTHRNPDIAQLAADHLFELDPNNLGNYILLCNIYTSAGMWDKVSRIRKLMRVKGLKKNAGYSWIEAKKGEIHEFFAGDMRHPMSTEIKQALEDLLNRLKANGYVPNLNSVAYDIHDDEKKHMLMNHSEKLALAYGLLSTDVDCPIKIMKNLRICEDCHEVMCGASKITGREIIIRDNMRFHHFHSGSCSCGNFW
ncbi:DYW domain containing protein [Trema orientale]|uniref:DYW domain containing protein n=1 Tax=Trema orientale TaxID=63057 RepID=A0A2P5FPA0_TREOI|nr:DYW domain containing protein [Trema orientale]